MIRIAMVCHRYYPDIGGVETHVSEISERLAKRGFDVEVICTDPAWKYPTHENHNGIKITRFKSFAPRNAFYFAPQVYWYLKNRHYDIVHAHNYHAFPALFASAASRGKFIFTPHYHGGSYSYLRNLLLKPYLWVGRSIFEKADKVICVSKFELKLIENDFKVSPSKLVHIPNGLNREEFKIIGELKKQSKIILYVGRMESYKGVQYLIEVLPLLKDYRLKLIGKGIYEKKLRELALRFDVNNRIDWLKDIKRDELLSHFVSADVFVNLSIFEAYGITVAEALACGTPCIVAIGGALEEFVDGKGCVGLSYPIDMKALAEAIESSKKITPREMPDWDDVTDKLIKIYSA
ncbi:MAG: glycosyltransferase family 4 protein [Candidatus Methanoperedens sp.]|nr:glycosyltransferase family 4 protein [Candidatus Methanoperedens sp.]MCZ7369041.1 glycosyltransferase family 4 protein [Candidatus Methanoperedens sp.]